MKDANHLRLGSREVCAGEKESNMWGRYVLERQRKGERERERDVVGVEERERGKATEKQSKAGIAGSGGRKSTSRHASKRKSAIKREKRTV